MVGARHDVPPRRDAPLRGDASPRGDVPLQEGPAGYSVFMVRAHLRDIPQVAFPEGFGIRGMRPGEGTLWTNIQRDAEPYFPIEDTLFQREFGYDLPATERRCFVVTNSDAVGVGVISAWYPRDPRWEGYGMVHWVAVRPAYQGRGLGKAMMTFTLNQLSQWHDRAFLGTQTKRLGAIKLYLDFGFVPDLEPPGAKAAWRTVQSQLKHAVLDAMDLGG